MEKLRFINAQHTSNSNANVKYLSGFSVPNDVEHFMILIKVVIGMFVNELMPALCTAIPIAALYACARDCTHGLHMYDIKLSTLYLVVCALY